MPRPQVRSRSFTATTTDSKHSSRTPPTTIEFPSGLRSKAAEEQRKSEEWIRATADIREEIEGLLEEARQGVIDEEFFKFPDEVKNAVAKAPEQRSPYEQQIAHRAKVISEPSLFLAIPRLKGEKKKRYEELKAELTKFDHLYHVG